MTREVTGRYGGVDAADRQAERRARLLDAALELLGTEGWQAATVRAICSGAKLTPRYFYEGFTDRDELLLALFDQIAQEAAAAVLEAVSRAPVDARAKAHAAIGAFVELVTDDPRKARVLFAEAMGSEPLTRRRFETLRMFAQLVAGQARDFYGMDDVADPLVEESALMLVGGLAEILLGWLDGIVHVTREQLIDDCTALFVTTGEGAVRLVQGRARR
ncbi:MAG TPA: helix-turn-helix domain-containing protein [Solirubrobacteraceae bacterium]